MPFFKFKGKKEKSVPKKASSLNNIYNDYSGKNVEPKRALGEQEFYRERRISASSVPLDPKLKELEATNEKLAKENNLLKLKVELLLDMLAQKTAEADFLESDLDKLRNVLLSTTHQKQQRRMQS